MDFPSKKPQIQTNDPLTLHWRIPEWFPQLSETEKNQLKLLHELLLKFNKTVNLISVKTIGGADNIHFADCILACRAISETVKIDELYDFGSGNGFPGIVFSILNPSTAVHLVELDQRKAEYLKNCISSIGLTRCDVMIRAVESLPAGSVKYAISRGFAPLAKSLTSTRRVFSKGARYYHLKSEEWASEIASLPTQLCSFWQPSLLSEYKLPVGEIRYAVVKTEKISD